MHLAAQRACEHDDGQQTHLDGGTREYNPGHGKSQAAFAKPARIQEYFLLTSPPSQCYVI